ncbi:MAG: hypothetical protein P8078_13150 [bacterium]
MNIINEIKRKLIHFVTILLPILYGYLPREEMLYICGGLLFLALLVEVLRFIWKPFSVFFYKLLSSLLRDNEKQGLTGATYIFLGIFLCLLLYDKWIAQAVMLFIIISDAFSAIVGKLWGTHKIYAEKTLEGGLAYMVTSFIIVYFIRESNILIGFAGVIASLLAEIFITRIDDNVTVAIIGGGTMQLLFMFNF